MSKFDRVNGDCVSHPVLYIYHDSESNPQATLWEFREVMILMNAAKIKVSPSHRYMRRTVPRLHVGRSLPLSIHLCLGPLIHVRIGFHFQSLAAKITPQFDWKVQMNK